jgi:hypothetical protein
LPPASPSAPTNPSPTISSAWRSSIAGPVAPIATPPTSWVNPPKVRDAAFAQLAEQFQKGQQKSTDPGWFDNFVKRVVDEEIRKAGGSPL